MFFQPRDEDKPQRESSVMMSIKHARRHRLPPKKRVALHSMADFSFATHIAQYILYNLPSWSSAYLYTYTHTHTYTYTCMSIRIHIRTNMYIYIYKYICVYMYMCANTEYTRTETNLCSLGSQSSGNRSTAIPANEEGESSR